MIVVLENPFLLPRYPKIKYINNLFGSNRMILFINVIVMSSSFLIACFMNDNPMVVNHKLCLYRMSFLLSRIVLLSSFIIFRPWNLLFCRIYERQESLENIFQLPLVFSAFLLCCIFFEVSVCILSYQTFNLLYISANVTLIQIKQKAS